MLRSEDSLTDPESPYHQVTASLRFLVVGVMVGFGLAGCTDDPDPTSAPSNASQSTLAEPTTETSASTTTLTELGQGQPRYVVGFEQYKGPQSSSGAGTLPKAITRYDRVTGTSVVLVEAADIVEGVSSVTILDADISPDGSSVAFTATWRDRERQKDQQNSDIYLSGLFEVPSDGSGVMRTFLQTDEPSRRTFSAVEYSPDGRRIAVADSDRLGVASTETGSVTWTDDAWAGGMAWAPDASEMAVVQAGSMYCSAVDVIQFRAGSGTFTAPEFASGGAGPWWDEAGGLHLTVPVNTNTRSGCRRPTYVARDTDATYRWVLGETGACWFSGSEPGSPVDATTLCTPLSLPNFFEPVSW